MAADAHVEVLSRFADAPAESAEEVDELLRTLLLKYDAVEDGKWTRIVEEFKPRAREEKSKKWLQNRVKKLGTSSDMDAGPSVSIMTTEKYGRALVAQKDIPAFSVIVAEAPLILGAAHCDEEEADDSLRQWCKGESISVQTALKVINFLKAFCAADEPTRGKVLMCYHTVPSESLPSATQSMLRLCDTVLAESWVNGVAKTELERVVVVKTLNAHSFATKSSLATAVFEHISVCNNSCSPNAMYTSQCSSHDGCGCLVARRAIAAGEHITLSYCESLLSRSLRLPYLKEVYAFDCDCAACTGDPDPYSAVPCPTCNPRDEDCLLPSEAGSWHDRPGFVYFHPGSEAPWVCDTCGGKFASNGIEVGGMTFERLERNLYIEQQGYENHSKEELKLPDLLYYFEYVYRHVGPRHSVALQVQFLLCDVLVAQSSQDMDALEKHLDGLISVLRRNGEHPGELLPFLAGAGHAFVRNKRFAKAKEYYNLALEFNVVFGPSSSKVKDLQKGLQACAKSDAKLIRGL